MNCSIAAVHPVAGGVIFLTLGYNLVYVAAFTALVTGTPEQDAGMVAVTQHQLAHALAVHLYELRHIAHILGGMCLIAGLVDYEQTVFIGQVKILVYRRIVRCAHTVEIELLEYLHIAAYGSLVHSVT